MLEPTETSKSGSSKIVILQPMGFADILDTMFSLYRRHFRLFLGITAVYLVGEFSMGILLDFPGLIPQRLLRLVMRDIVFFLSILVSMAAVVIASATLYLGNQITGRAALRQGLQQFFSLLKCTFVWIIVAGGLAITVIGIPFGIYFAVRWGFYVQTLLLEKSLIRVALRRSSELVRGMWWHVCGILLAILLIDTVIHAAFEISFGCILILSGFAGEIDLIDIIRWATFDDSIFGADNLILYAIVTGVHLVVSAFLFPIWGIGTTLLYFNQRIEKEGFDIEMRARTSRALDGKHKM